MIETALFARLTAVSGVASLVAEDTSPVRYRIYPLLIPQQVDGDVTRYPCVVYAKDGVERQVTLTGTDSVVRASFQIDCCAQTFAGSLALASAVFAALKDYAGTSGGVEIKAFSLENEFSVFDPEPGLFRVSQFWSIWFVES